MSGVNGLISRTLVLPGIKRNINAFVYMELIGIFSGLSFVPAEISLTDEGTSPDRTATDLVYNLAHGRLLFEDEMLGRQLKALERHYWDSALEDALSQVVSGRSDSTIELSGKMASMLRKARHETGQVDGPPLQGAVPKLADFIVYITIYSMFAGTSIREAADHLLSENSFVRDAISQGAS